MIRRTLVLLSFVAGAVAVAQDGEREARVLRWFIEAQINARPERPVLASIIADTADTAANSLVQRLRARGLPIVPLVVSLAARPGGDTLYVRVTRLVRDSLNYYRLGVERLECRDGQLQFGRTIVTLQCEADTCRDYHETPMGDPGWELGRCGRP